MLDWLREHQGLVIAVTASLGAGVVGMIAAMIVVVRLPPGYLRKEANGKKRKRGWKRIAQNVLGWGLIVAGIAMMVLPGPGMVVVLVGVAMADFPGKQRLLRWILSRGGVLKAMNRLRARFEKPPLQRVA